MGMAWAACKICGYREEDWGGPNCRVDLSYHVMVEHPTKAVPPWFEDLNLRPTKQQEEILRSYAQELHDLHWLSVDAVEGLLEKARDTRDSTLDDYRRWNSCRSCTWSQPCNSHRVPIPVRESGTFAVVPYDIQPGMLRLLAFAIKHASDLAPVPKLRRAS